MTVVAKEWAYRACLACLALMIMVPPLNLSHTAPLPSFFEECLAFAFGLGAVLFGLAGRRFNLGGVPRFVPWAVALVVVLGGQMLLRDLPYREQALIPAMYVLWAAGVGWVGWTLRTEVGAERAATVLASCVLAVASVSAAFALIQAFGVRTPLNAHIAALAGQRAHANLNQPNLLAHLLALGAVSAVFLRSSAVVGSVAAGAVLILLTLAMSLTGSLASFAYLGWALAWSLWWALSFPSDSSRKAVRAAAFAVAAFLAAQGLFGVLGVNPQAVPMARAMGLGFAQEGPSSLAVRIYIWRQAVHMFAESPLAGVGPGMFAWNFLLNSPAFDGVPGIDRLAHNLVLQLLAETGVVGAAPIVIVIVLWLASNRSPRDQPWSWWCVAFAGVALLHSLVENPLMYANFLGPFAVVFGLGERVAYRLRRERLLRFTVLALIAVGAVTLANAFIGYRDAQAWLNRAQASSSQAQEGAGLTAMHRSILRPYAELLASAGWNPGTTVDADVLNLSARLVRSIPIDLAVYRHIRLLAQAGRAEDARSLLLSTLVAYPDALGDLRRELESAPESAATRELLRLLDERAPGGI